MKIKLDVESPAGVSVPVTVTAEGTATVADLSSVLWAGLTGTPADPQVLTTLQVMTEERHEVATLASSAMLTDTRLCSGQRVRVVRASGSSGSAGSTVGWLRVISGSMAGTSFQLHAGSAVIGRDPECDIVLDDNQVSRRHARLTMGERVVEITDLNSSNGVVVGDTLVAHATLGPRDVVEIGNTGMVVERADDTAADSAALDLDFNRSPVVRPKYEGRKFQAPQPPSPPKPGRFPLVAMIAPLVMGVAMYLFTHNPLSIVFVALSPLIAIGTWLDRRMTDRKSSAQANIDFDESVKQLNAELAQALAEEHAARCAETPTLDALVEAAYGLTPDLWSRRPDDEDFLRLNLGYGDAATRHTLDLPSRGQATAAMWASLETMQRDNALVKDVPITASLGDAGNLGLSGPRDWLDPVARSVVAQIITLHSPAELVLCGIASTVSSARWNWLMWLPHVGSPHSPLPGWHLANSPGAVSALVSSVEELIELRGSSSKQGQTLEPAIVLLVENDAPVERGRLVAVAEDGPKVGVHVVWLAERQEELPAACRTFVAFNTKQGAATAGFVDDNEAVLLNRVDSLSLAAAEHLARRIAPVTDAGAPTVDQSDLPRSVSYLALTGPELADDPARVVDLWRESGTLLGDLGKRSNATLRALIGQGPQGEFVLDLRTQGPHALVGGTTGSGKSEFLQSWILGLATAHSPRRVSFLFVDYKGGAAFADCVRLPHTVGLVTDLSPHLVRRALTSLRAELRYREHLLNQKKAKDLISLERTGDPDCPPALIIVVDEFAALAKEMPEFVDGAVDVAQRGRSLGLHLILATQRPAGVIKDNLRANTNLRVALRMADNADSSDVIGTPLAAEFDSRVPGRGAVRTGPGRIALFQTGYAGGRTSSEPPPVEIDVESLTFGPGQAWEIPVAPQAVPKHLDEGPTDISRVVSVIQQACVNQAIPEPRKPWLPDLVDCYDLAKLTAVFQAGSTTPGHGEHLVLGVLDDPSQQAQYPVAYDPDHDGNIAVYGTSGSGKSAVLRTLAFGAALGCTRSRTEIYGLDFGATGLSMLQPLPIVGDIIDGADHERIARLLTRLIGILDDRAQRYAAARTGSITDYRATTGETSEARILLLIDGFGSFREAYENEPGRTQYMSMVSRLLAEGRSVGIHVALTADRPGAIPSSMGANIQQRLVMRQAEEAGYMTLAVAKDILNPDSPPGRCVFSGQGNELQIAVPGGSTSTSDQAQAIDALATHLDTQGITPAAPVERLATSVSILELPDNVGGLPTLGLADTTLAPMGYVPQGTFTVAGLSGSGRSTTLRGLAQGLHRWNADIPMYYFGPRRSPVGKETVWTQTATHPEAMRDLAQDLTELLEQPAEATPGAIIMIESLMEIMGTPADQALIDMIKLARRNGHFVIGEAETMSWGSAWPLFGEIRNGRRGIVMQPDQADGDPLFHVTFPRMKRADFPPGRGVFVEAGKLWIVQLPLPSNAPPPDTRPGGPQ